MLKYTLCFVSLIGLFSCASIKNKGADKTLVPHGVIAHRGAFKKNKLPENSIASLQEAIRLGCAGSEFDVRITADDTLIVHHDPHYRKMDIEATPYSDLVKVPLANGEPLPTLRTYLRAGLQNNRHTKLVVEIKPSPAGTAKGQAIAEKVVALVREIKAEHMAIYISFDYEILKKVHALDPSAQTQYLDGNRTPDQLKADGISGADYHFSVYKKNEDWIAGAQKNKLVLNAWTVNNKADMEWFLNRGFNYITTDEPELLLQTWQAFKGTKK